MKLPSFKRLFKTDYEPQYHGLVDRLSSSLNVGVELLYDALNKRLTVRENFAATAKDLQVQVNAAGMPISDVRFTLDVPGTILGLQAVKVDNLSVSTSYPTGGVFVSYTQNGNSIIVTNVTGLQAGNLYQIRVIAWN
jgi:phage baseplate assembly protein gpV